MRSTDDLREVIRAEFARLDVDDTGLTGRLEERAVAAAGGADPEAAAAVAVAVVEAAHAVVEEPDAPVVTVGDLSARGLVAAALRPRRTPRAGA
ncbi:hypothetical protein GCM10009795_049500 [Nocardioides hankookensis]|uniref:Uncharacterized protein n=1 Tax=Nocardioides hankookensis TaxID=443157 RepID=A0ABW1LFL4_9ACTN